MGSDKYARRVAILGNQVTAMLKEAGEDAALTREQREDIVWELARLREAAAQSTAALVALAVNEMEQ